jgi:hypothetical protein
MDARDDPEYLRRYREYSHAMRDLTVAVDAMIQVWNEVEVIRRSTPPDGVRRPVGAGPNWRRPAAPKPKPRKPYRPKPIYLGRILGYITPKAAPGIDEPLPIDYNRIRVEAAEKRCWNAVDRYEEAKRAFFDYVRRQQVDYHERMAKDDLTHGADLQLLGGRPPGDGRGAQAR